MIGREERYTRDGWLSIPIQDSSQFKQYSTAFYFIVTTMTTVGYGDMSADTVLEQFYCVILMLVGVFVFSVVSGSLASILASFDQ